MERIVAEKTEALRLANDGDWKRALEQELRRKSHVLYENTALVRELEQFLEASVAAAAEGRKVRAWGGGTPAAHDAKG